MHAEADISSEWSDRVEGDMSDGVGEGGGRGMWWEGEGEEGEGGCLAEAL